MDISKKIIEIRKSKGLTQEDLAEKTGLARGNYARLEKRGNKMTFEQIHNIAQAMGMTGVELINEAAEESGEAVNSEKIGELEDSNKKSVERIRNLENLILRIMVVTMDIHDFAQVVLHVINTINPTGSDKKAYNQITLEELTKGMLERNSFDLDGNSDFDVGFMYHRASSRYLTNYGDYTLAEVLIEMRRDAMDKVDEINTFLDQEDVKVYLKRLNRLSPNELADKFREGMNNHLSKVISKNK